MPCRSGTFGICSLLGDSGGLGARFLPRGVTSARLLGLGVEGDGESLRPVINLVPVDCWGGFLEEGTEFANSGQEGVRLDHVGAGVN